MYPKPTSYSVHARIPFRVGNFRDEKTLAYITKSNKFEKLWW